MHILGNLRWQPELIPKWSRSDLWERLGYAVSVRARAKVPYLIGTVGSDAQIKIVKVPKYDEEGKVVGICQYYSSIISSQHIHHPTKARGE